MSKKSKVLIAVSLTLQLMTGVLRFSETWIDHDRQTIGVCCTQLEICPATTPKGETIDTHNVYYVKFNIVKEPCHCQP